MKNKQVKKLRSYAERYKIILGALIMVGALLAVSSTQLQVGFIAADTGFTVPFPDGEARMNSNATFDLTWTYMDDLAISGFESYEIKILRDQIWTSVYNGTVSGSAITYTLDSSLYENGDVLIIRMLAHSPVIVDNITTYDITWDDVTIQILDPVAGEPSATITTTPTGQTPPPNQPTSGEDVLIILMFGIGIFFSIMVVGMMIGRRRG